MLTQIGAYLPGPSTAFSVVYFRFERKCLPS